MFDSEDRRIGLSKELVEEIEISEKVHIRHEYVSKKLSGPVAYIKIKLIAQ